MVTAGGAIRVVAAAVVADRPEGRVVLAARRTGPPEVAGGWELPGGKCRAAESLAEAAERELREELGVEVSVTGRLSGVSPIRAGLTLEVVTARIDSGEPVPTEHDQLRWLGADQLDSVAWLPADRPFLAELRVLLEAE